jgi:3-hydroxyethyl bacteriochlorophyllide a dehydrogenase
METTEAIVVPQPYELTFQTVKLRALGRDEVLVKTRYTSISAGTERMLLAGQLVEMAGLPFPCIPGYETVGEVIETGPDVPEGFLGQLVFIGGSYGYEGVTPAWGGQSRYISAPYQKAFRLNGVDPAQAVAIAPAATAWHGVELIAPQEGELVLVLGQGPIGQFAAQAAKLKGATVVVADVVASRLEKAAAGDYKIDLSHQTLKEGLPGQIDVFIDATGKMPAISANLMQMKARGRVLLLGFYQKIELNFAIPFIKELSFRPSREWAAEDIPAVIEALRQQRLSAAHLFTHRFPIAQYQVAYQTALEDPECLKVLMEWNKG